MEFELAYSGTRGRAAKTTPPEYVQTLGTYQSISVLASILNKRQDDNKARVWTFYPTPRKVAS